MFFISACAFLIIPYRSLNDGSVEITGFAWIESFLTDESNRNLAGVTYEKCRFEVIIDVSVHS